MTTTLVLPDPIASTLRGALQLDVETGAVLLARLVREPSGLRLLGVGLHLVPDHAYIHRMAHSLLINSEGYVPALAEAEFREAIPIWLHTHPGALSPSPSVHDQRVDEQLSDVFRLRSGSPYYGALILSSDQNRIRFTGHIDNGTAVTRLDRLLTVGQRIALAWHEQADKAPLRSLFDRNIRAFGGDVQRVLSDLRIAIVGCGGTGSAVAEQLVRLGVRCLTLCDPDVVSESNLTRLYGSKASSVGQPKVEVLAQHLTGIAPDASIDTHASMITVEATARSLIGADVVFGCTDDNAGRLVLSRLATFLLVPVIDCGVLLSSHGAGVLSGIHGRVTVLHPGSACLVCRGRVDLARAQSEALTAQERVRRTVEGYAPALPGVEPAVVAFTTLVAATAVCELLERITGYGPEPPPSETLLRIHERELSTNVAWPVERHYCHPDSGKLGLGVTEPFLEQTWRA